MNSIFDTQLLFVKMTADGISIHHLNVQDLRWENEGRPEFVRAVLSTILDGRIYDDSDPDAYVDGCPLYYYLPSDRVKADDIPVSCLARVLEVLNDPQYREAAYRLLELAEEADTANPSRLREIDTERAEIEADLAKAFVELLQSLEEAPDDRSDVS